MKKLLLLVVAVSTVVLVSCTPQRIIYRESSGRNVEPTQGAVFTPALVADLHIMTDKSISNTIVFEDILVTTAILNDIDNYKKMALFKTIQKYNADIMVASLTNVDTNAYGQLEITVVGYPARYVNFRQIGSRDSVAMKYTEKVFSQSKNGDKQKTKELSLNLFNKKK